MNDYFKSKSSESIIIIGQGSAKYHDLSVGSRSLICQSRKLRQIIDLQDTDKSLNLQ